MTTIFIMSWVLAIFFAIIYTVIAVKDGHRKIVGNIIVTWFAMITCGWVLGFVVVALAVFLYVRQLFEKPKD